VGLILPYVHHHPGTAEGFEVVGIRNGWKGLVNLIRDPKADNSQNCQILSEEIVNKAGRTGGTFLHTSRTNPMKMKLADVPAQYKDQYREPTNDLIPEVLKNLDFLGIDYI
jgi:6-phosphofructokinase 1